MTLKTHKVELKANIEVFIIFIFFVEQLRRLFLKLLRIKNQTCLASAPQKHSNGNWSRRKKIRISLQKSLKCNCVKLYWLVDLRTIFFLKKRRNDMIFSVGIILLKLSGVESKPFILLSCSAGIILMSCVCNFVEFNGKIFQSRKLTCS